MTRSTCQQHLTPLGSSHWRSGWSYLWPWGKMRTMTGQVGLEDSRGQSPGSKQHWPLMLLGLAVATHGLLPLTTTFQSRMPDPWDLAGAAFKAWGIIDSYWPLGDRSQVLTWWVLVWASVTVVCPLGQDPAPHPRSDQVCSLGYLVSALPQGAQQ